MAPPGVVVTAMLCVVPSVKVEQPAASAAIERIMKCLTMKYTPFATDRERTYLYRRAPRVSAQCPHRVKLPAVGRQLARPRQFAFFAGVFMDRQH